MAFDALTFEAIHLKTVVRFASKDPTRAHLASVAVAKHALVATDGHRVIVVRTSRSRHDIPTSDEMTLVPEVAVIAAIKIKGAYAIKVSADSLDVFAETWNLIASIPYKPLKDKYAPVAQVIPDMEATRKKVTAFVNINPEYLAAGVKAMIDIGAYGTNRGIRYQVGQYELDPIRLDGTTDDGATVTIIIMPMRA